MFKRSLYGYKIKTVDTFIDEMFSYSVVLKQDLEYLKSENEKLESKLKKIHNQTIITTELNELKTKIEGIIDGNRT